MSVMRCQNGVIGLLLVTTLFACTGDKTDPSSPKKPAPATTLTPLPTPTPEPTLPPEPETPGIGKLMLHDKQVVSPGRRLPLTGVAFTLMPEEAEQLAERTNERGEFAYQDATGVTFTLLDQTFGPFAPQGLITVAELAQQHCASDTAIEALPSADPSAAVAATDSTYEAHAADETDLMDAAGSAAPADAAQTSGAIDTTPAGSSNRSTAMTASAVNDAADAVALARCRYRVEQNLLNTLRSLDADTDSDNGMHLSAAVTAFPHDLKAPIDVYTRALAKQLARTGKPLRTAFQPSLGINLEEPQPEADDVGGQPIPFADLFRIGRPFPEYSCSQISYDDHGWPLSIPPECADEVHDKLKVPSYATTLIARFVPLGALPTGKYTVLYEGSGTIQYSGIGLKLPTESTAGRDIIEISAQRLSTKHLNNAGLRVQISATDSADPIRNIRIIMPGGTCAGNPFVHVYRADECPAAAYQSFVSRYEQDSNAIVFNPQFMSFLKDFKVIRTMNFMKASPRNPCYAFKDDAYQACLLQELNWEQRAKMQDAMWGGSYLTDLAKRAGRGVPLEVTVALANQLKRDPWFNIPHNATDDYITQYATYVRDHLDSTLKAYIEYSNEPWNGPFWVNPYTIAQGKARAIEGRNDYWIGLAYYVERSVEVFNHWQEIWGSTERLIRTINTQHNGGEFASRYMLAHNDAYQSIDALASAPYFFGCWNRANQRCKAIDMVLPEITSVDDIFAILDDPKNPYGMASTKSYVKRQAEAAQEFEVDLISYEGGQHLTITWGDSAISHERKRSLLDLFRAANRDPRMAERYAHLLNGWKQYGGKLFTLYTMPQTYHTFGSFGLKEHLGQARAEAPKYAASMRFQEHHGLCWWEHCAMGHTRLKAAPTPATPPGSP